MYSYMYLSGKKKSKQSYKIFLYFIHITKSHRYHTKHIIFSDTIVTDPDKKFYWNEQDERYIERFHSPSHRLESVSLEASLKYCMLRLYPYNIGQVENDVNLYQ